MLYVLIGLVGHEKKSALNRDDTEMEGYFRNGIAKRKILRAGFEPATYGCLFLLYSPPLYQLSYQRL